MFKEEVGQQLLHEPTHWAKLVASQNTAVHRGGEKTENY